MATSFMLAAKLVVLLQLLLFSRSLKTGPNMRDTPPSICQLRRPTDDYLNHKIAEWEKASGVEIWVENVRGGNVALTVEIHVFSRNWTSLELQVRPLDKLTAIGGWTLLDDARKDIKTASCASPSDTAILYNIRNKENSNKTRLKLRWKSVTPVFDNLEIIVLINRNSTSWFTVTSSLLEKISTARKGNPLFLDS
ncbi:uncharacterized protein LOC102801591 [Saccoglossus kowalevskii]|uniref:Uncharacterized protein LOC102801591 n=1 Tax=Saccoglossus kowalevskii TaxID=10224 RepID=A0ABM0N040_SACKO|nr:PREDICTED: uncharacterized protein LOC102801591 [Saccoglossus kowalevskii]